MAGFNLADYQTVQERIEIFWRLYPEGRILNEIVLTNDRECIIKCSVWKDGSKVMPDSVDFAQEPITEKGINSVSAIENCSTSATGRALSLLGGELSPSKKRASATEMEKRGRKLLQDAKLAHDKGDVAELRELYTEAKETMVSPSVIQEILALGTDAAKKNTSAGKEQTAEVQA